MNTLDLVKRITDILDDRQAIDIEVLEVKDLTTVTDYMIICSGLASTHVKSLGERVEEVLEKEDNIFALRKEGMTGGVWSVLDYGDVLVHVMLPEIRQSYQLEKLWAKNRVVD